MEPAAFYAISFSVQTNLTAMDISMFSCTYLPKEHDAQYLALCPLCAAKYDEFIKTDDDLMAELKEAIVSTEDCEIPISLGDEKTSIRFVESHFQDIKSILGEMG